MKRGVFISIEGPDGSGKSTPVSYTHLARGLRQWLNHCSPCELGYLSAGEESGIPSVAVKCVDIRRNTSGEGGFLD